MPIKAVFIKNLKKYRNYHGFSQMKLADLCDTSTSYIGQIEIGNRFPSVEMIEKIAGALQIKPYLLFYDEDDIKPMDKSQSVQTYVMSNSMKNELTKRITTAIQRIIKEIK